MEQIELNEKLENIKFTDVMKIIASDNTKPEDKIVYIFLLNMIMDLTDEIDDIKTRLK